MGPMDREELGRYLHEHIPLSAAMEARVVSASFDSVVLQAPLAPNINHRETVFGGSASALAILAAWSLVHTRLAADGISCRIVIQRNCIDYDAPMPTDFSATSMLAEGESWERFARTLARRGKSRVTIRCVLASEGVDCGTFEGAFVAIDTGR